MGAAGDVEARAALRRALEGSRGGLMDVAQRAAPAEPAPAADDLDDQATAQFLHAFSALMLEALDGDGRTLRDLVFDSAIPAMVAQGQSSMVLLEGHVAFFVVLSRHLVEAVPEDVRDDAERWLAQYFAGYAREVTERAQALEAGTA